MKLEKLMQSLLMTGSVVVFLTTPAQGKEVKSSHKSAEPSLKASLQLARNAQKLVQVPTSTQVVQITGVKLNSTDKGFEIILETSQGEKLQVVPKTEGNVYTIEIPSAQLSGDTFRQEKPIVGINEVIVSNQNANTVSIQVIGTSTLPTVELFDGDEGLIFGITAPASTAQPQPTPITPAPQKIVEINQIQLNSKENSLEIILETSEGEKLQVTPKSEGNTYSIDISAAQLRLPNNDIFRQTTPFTGISEVTVTNLNDNTIRVAVIGTNSIPKVELFDSDRGLIFSAIPTTSASQTEESTPETETQPEQPTANQEPIELIVTGEQDGYFIPEATTGTKIDVPLRDVPASVQVIPREVIEDRQVVKLNELADNVSGVQQQGTYGGLNSQGYFIRGFASEFESLRNGFKDFGFISPRDIANVDRVEFLKGPASILYGNITSPGGVVNTITKKPLPDPFYQINGTIGSYGFYRGTVDFTGPLTENRSALYRINAAYQNSDSFRDFVNDNESVFIAPSLTLNVGEKTKLTFDYEYQKYDYIFDRGFLPENVSFNVPISRFLGEPTDRSNFKSNNFTYTLESKFGNNDSWKFRQGLNILNTDGVSVSSQPNSLDEDGRTVNRRFRTADEQQRNITFQNEVSGKIKTGSITHNVLLGFEISSYDFQYDFSGGTIAPIDIFNPVYGARPEDISLLFSEKYGSDNIALYFQNLIELTPNIKFLAGGRFDWVDSFYEDKLTNTTFNETSDSRFSPRLGIVYQPSNSTSLYASWTNSFNPQIFSRSRTDEPFKPETSEQFEVGIKQEFFNKKLSATLAYFDISKKNVLTTDPADPDFSIQTGKQKSRGINLDIIGEIVPGWKIIGTYAYTNAFVAEDNDPTLVDNRLIGVPYNSASLWTTYEFQKGSLQGLGLGFGLVYSGEREASLPNTDVELPSYVRADASVFYKRNNWRAALNFKNLFDKKYYNSQGFYIVPAEPFTVLGTISVEF